MHVTEEINVGEVTFTGSGPVLTQEMLKQVNIDWGLDEYLSQMFRLSSKEMPKDIGYKFGQILTH